MKYEIRNTQEDFYELLKANTLENENEICFSFYEHGGVVSQSITRKLLLEKSLCVAKELQSRGAKKGDRVIIFATQTSDNIYAVFGSMLAGTIFTLIPLPVDESKRMRFESVMDSCAPKFILCNQEKLSELVDQQFDLPVIDCSQCLEHEGFIPAHLDFDDIIYIQYTSGSTSAPKGIMVSYGNLISAVNISPRVNELKRIFGWVPFFHNLGLLYLIYIPALTKHVTVGIISQALFLEHPEDWLLGLHNFKADCTLAPNSAYDLYPRLVPASKLKGIDLSHVEVLLNGSEMVRNSTMDRFSKEYESLGLKSNCFCVGYGLSETTCGVCAQLGYTDKDTIDIDFDTYRLGKLALAKNRESETMQFVSNGTSLYNTKIKIVNPKTLEECEENKFGEVWVQSPTVAQGYYKDQKATEECFHWKLRGYDGEFLRTGDMGIVQDGNIFITGRIKELIIINGNNILPNDIISKLKETVEEIQNFNIIPFSVMDQTKERFILILGVPDVLAHNNSYQFMDKITKSLFKYFQVTPYDIKVIKNSMLPYTDSGKLSFHKLVKLYQDDELVDVRSNSATCTKQVKSEIKYATSTQEKLGSFIEQNFNVKALATDNILDYGMDSLDVMEFSVQIEDSFSVSIPISYIFENPTIEKVGEYIDRAIAGEDLSVLEKDKRFLYDEVELDSNIQPGTYDSLKPAMKNVFVTGTTGFLGAYLINRLLDHTKATLYCHVRAKSKEAGAKRIKENMIFYKLWKEEYKDRIRPILGSLDLPHLGIKSEEYEELSKCIDTIYHNGAILNFIYPYQRLKQTNVCGTMQTIELACYGKPKFYNYISSYSVYDNPSHFKKVVYEDDKLENCCGYFLPYSESKWVAENIIQIARERGLKACIFRPGEITGAVDTGIWKLGDSVSRTIKAIIETGEYPDIDMNIHMTQIDYIASAIVAISKKGNSYGKAFNLLNDVPVPVKRLGEIINTAGYFAKPVDYDTFRKDIYKADNKHPLKLLESLFKTKKKDKEETLEVRYGEVSPSYDMSNTEKALKDTGISCEPMNEELIEKYIENFA